MLQASGRSGDSMGDDTRKTGHILIVDDDPTMRQMVTGYFEEHNVPAGAVSSRSELSRHFAAATQSLIILDLRLGRDYSARPLPGNTLPFRCPDYHHHRASP